MYKLSAVEAVRTQVLLEDSLKKLQFLSALNVVNAGNSSKNAEELTQFMGDEISRIIKEQKDLEKSYEDLLHQRGALKGLLHKKEFADVQNKIQDVRRAEHDSVFVVLYFCILMLSF